MKDKLTGPDIAERLRDFAFSKEWGIFRADGTPATTAERVEVLGIFREVADRIDRVAALCEEGHEGQHEPGPDLHGWVGPCWPCEIAKALNG